MDGAVQAGPCLQRETQLHARAGCSPSTACTLPSGSKLPAHTQAPAVVWSEAVADRYSRGSFTNCGGSGDSRPLLGSPTSQTMDLLYHP